MSPHDETESQRKALAWCAAAAVAVILWITMPVSVGIFLGALMGFVMQPVYERMARRMRPTAAATVTVVGTGIAIAAVVGGLGFLLIDRGVGLAQSLLAAIGPGGAANPALTRLTERASHFGLSTQSLESRLQEGASNLVERAATIAEGVAAATASALLGLFFATLAMFFMFRHFPRMAARAQRLLPLRPEHTRALFAAFRRIGRTTLLGTVVTGVAQGVLATIGYVIAGVPEPFFFGALTAVASLLPAVGTLIVWVPAGVVLFASDRVGRGVFELLWGAIVVVGVSDYVIRPRLVGGEENTPTVVTFAALFGGVEVFGLKGLVLGPVLMMLGIAVLQLYAKERGAV